MIALDESLPTANPATAAATVVILRDGAMGPAVLMLRRRQSLADFGGLWAFPGGKVETADRAYAAWLRSQTPPAVAADLFATPAESAPSSSVLAAIRETFEETGLLFAEGWAAASAERFQRHRSDWQVAVARDATAFEALMTAETLRPATQALHYWSRWLPPHDIPRRFDTDFFMALAPTDQEPLADLGEATDVRWVALADVASPQLDCAPVTRLALLDLRRRYTQSGSLPALLAHVQTAPTHTIQTCRTEIHGEAYVLFPWDAAYHTSGGAGDPWTDAELADMADLPSRLPIQDGLFRTKTAPAT
jgi:8-oxo-dGTP pyrophosphatase MutT (NUDIX family)